MDHLDCLEKVLQKAKTLMESYRGYETVSINGTENEWIFASCYGSDGGKGFHQYLEVASVNGGDPSIVSVCNGDLRDLGSFFENVADPTEVELENFELETGYPFILSEEGLKSMVEAGSSNFTRLVYYLGHPSSIKVHERKCL